MPRRRRRTRRRTKRSYRKRAPSPVRETQPFTASLQITPNSDTTPVVATKKIEFAGAGSNDLAIIGIRGSMQASIYHGSAGEHQELAIVICTPSREQGGEDIGTKLSTFDPFSTDVLEKPIERGFNIVRVHRLANAHPTGAPNMVYTFNRRFTRSFRRVMNASAPLYVAVYGLGKGNTAIVLDGGIKFVRND